MYAPPRCRSPADGSSISGSGRNTATALSSINEIDSVTPVVDVIEYFELAVREAVNPPRATAALTNLGRRVMEIFKPTNRNGLSFVAPSLKFKYVTRALEVLTLGVMIGTLIGAYLKLGL